MAQWMEVVPAYGRDYANQKAVKADWAAGKDFQVPYGPYVNKQDADAAGLKVIVRYAKQMKVVAV